MTVTLQNVDVPFLEVLKSLVKLRKNVVIQEVNDDDKEVSSEDHIKQIGVSNSKSCLAVFNKRITELYIFQKIAYDTYYCFIIHLGRWNRYVFKLKIRSLSEMHVLRNGRMWANAEDVEYYEISKEAFNDLSKLYDKLGRK